jgi:hypothetical protein
LVLDRLHARRRGRLRADRGALSRPARTVTPAGLAGPTPSRTDVDALRSVALPLWHVVNPCICFTSSSRRR